MTIEEGLNRLDTLQRKLCAYNHAAGLIYYDGATTAPKGSAANRGESLAILGEEAYKLSTGEETGALLDFLHENRQSLDEAHNRIVELMRKSLVELRAIPVDEYTAYQRLVTEAEDVWHTAKETDNYAMFAPYIDKIVAALKKQAAYIAPDKNPYDYWLNSYEEGLDCATCDQFFETLRARLMPLVKAVCDAEPVDDHCLHGDFPIEKQRELSDYLMALIGLDRAHCGIGETEHPFTTSFTKYDARITTHYERENFASSMYSVIHEGGHALYDTHPADEFAYTVLGGGVSMGIHESQSRFYENLLGRSRAFIGHIAPRLRELFPSLNDVDDETLYKAINKSQPSLIRTEADELTYCLHVMVRYELEKKLFSGELTAKDLPAAWNALYKEYLGIDVLTDREGVLQDSHWAGGAFGYFPSYALGSAYGAQLLEKMKETVDVDACMEKGDFAPINAWLEDRIWRFGSIYKPGELFEKAVGARFNPDYYVNYLTEKYSPRA